MLPRVKINFANGALGTVSPSADGVAGLVCTAVAVANKLELRKPYILYRLEGLEELGVTKATDDANAFLYKQVKEFYDQAGDGAELWLYGVPNTVLPSVALDVTEDYAKDLIRRSNGRIRALAVAFSPASSYEPTIEGGLDSDVMTAALKAQALAEWATNTLYAPLVVLIEGRGYTNANITALPELTSYSYNRVGILIGDTVTESTGAAIGVLLGKVAGVPVQRHIGRVRDGALNLLVAYVGDKDAALADSETLNNKGFITFRVFVGKSGYFFSEDCLGTATSDDYRSIANRRVVDKAYRIAYQTMLEHVNDELAVTEEGTPVAAVVKSWETEVEMAIVNQMTSQGELGNDPNDMGVKVFIDYTQNIVSTGRLGMTVQVKPYGYAKYIDVELGFMTIQKED